MPWFLRERGKQLNVTMFSGVFSYAKCWLLTIVQGFLRLFSLQKALQFVMSIVAIGEFVHIPKPGEYGYAEGYVGMHRTTLACNSVEGFENYDMYIATGSSVVFYCKIFPAIYELSKIVVPGNPTYATSCKMLMTRSKNSRNTSGFMHFLSTRLRWHQTYGLHGLPDMLSVV